MEITIAPQECLQSKQIQNYCEIVIIVSNTNGRIHMNGNNKDPEIYRHLSVVFIS